MQYLLDTHGLIWWWDGHHRLSRRVRELLVDRRNQIFISAVSAWEIANKVRSGKLPSMRFRVADYHGGVIDDGFSHLAVDDRHALEAGMIVSEHRDPFDRLLAAQAKIENMTLLTRDAKLAALCPAVIW